MEPQVRVCTEHGACLRVSLSPSAPPLLARSLSLSLSLSQIRWKKKKIKDKLRSVSHLLDSVILSAMPAAGWPDRHTASLAAAQKCGRSI